MKFCDITTSIKTKLAFITLLGPRLTDPTSKTDQLLGIFRFAEEKTKVEDILKARQAKITSKQFVSGKGSPAAGRGGGAGRGSASTGRGGRGGLTLGAKSAASAPAKAPEQEPVKEPEIMVIETTRPSFHSAPPAIESIRERESRRTSFKDLAERNSIASRKSIILRPPEVPSTPETVILSPPIPPEPTPDPVKVQEELEAVLKFTELTRSEVSEGVPSIEIWECLAEHEAELDKEATLEIWEQVVEVQKAEAEEEAAIAAIVEKIPGMVFEDEISAITPGLVTQVRRHSDFLKKHVPEQPKNAQEQNLPRSDASSQQQQRGSIRHSTLGVKNVINQFTTNKRRSSFLQTVKESFPAVEQRKTDVAPKRMTLKAIGYDQETKIPFFDYDILVQRNAAKNYEGGLLKSDLEMHLTNEDFVTKFGCTKAEFKVLPNWRKTSLKKSLLLF